jgi:hypothetical protein
MPRANLGKGKGRKGKGKGKGKSQGQTFPEQACMAHS